MMGNQASGHHSSGSGSGGVGRQQRNSSDDTILPPHVPIGNNLITVQSVWYGVQVHLTYQTQIFPGIKDIVKTHRERRHSENQDQTLPMDARLRQLSGDGDKHW